MRSIIESVSVTTFKFMDNSMISYVGPQKEQLLREIHVPLKNWQIKRLLEEKEPHLLQILSLNVEASWEYLQQYISSIGNEEEAKKYSLELAQGQQGFTRGE